MDEQVDGQASTMPRPSTEDAEAWKVYWQAQRQPWRIKPEITTDCQKELDDCRKKTDPDIKQGNYPFKGMKLSRAKVEWLLATHESGGKRGPVDLRDEGQRTREGLDIRGACLQGEDLSGLPLARLCGGLTVDEWVWCSKEQREMAAVNLQKAHLAEADLQEACLTEANLQKAFFEKANLQKAGLRKADLQEADFWGADLQEAHLAEANLQKADLGKANLQKADLGKANLQKAYLAEADLQEAHLAEANLQKANLGKANLQNAYLAKTNLQEANFGGANLRKANLWRANLRGTNLTRAELKGADLEKVTLGNEKHVGPQFVDCQWGDSNLAVIEWSQMKMPGDEYIAQQKKGGQGQIEEKEASLSEYKVAVRANRQLAVVLRGQGLNEQADDFAYRAQILQLHVVQLQMLQRLDQAQMDAQKQARENQDTSTSERLNIPQFFTDFLHWPSSVLSTVKRTPDSSPPERVFLLLLQLVFLTYLFVSTPVILSFILFLCMSFIFAWLSGLAVSLAAHLPLMLLPKQTQRPRYLLALSHLPTIEQFKRSVCSAVQQTFVLTQLFSRTLSGHVSSIFSSLLDLLAGYGYKPWRTLIWYLLTILTFAGVYYGIWTSNHLEHVTGQALNIVGAVTFSVMAFHGRGLFLGGEKLGYDDLIIILGAAEAVIGLFIELSFIATFTGRFFRR